MTMINVWRRYDGNRAPEPIEEGAYSVNDPRLFGLARYLVDNGNARWVNSEPRVAHKVWQTAPADEITRDDIKSELDARGIDYDGRWATDKLRELLDDDSA